MGLATEERGDAGHDEPVAVDVGVRFPREHRLRRRQEFLRVQRDGARVHTAHFVVVVLRRPEGGALRRLGITVTKKVSGAAVDRNRVKRVAREVFRRNRHLFPEGCDVVIIAKSGAPSVGYQAAARELAKVQRALENAANRRPTKGPRPDKPEAR